MGGQRTDGRLTDERSGRSGRADGRTGRRTEEVDGLTEITGGLTDADGQADGWKGEGQTGGMWTDDRGSGNGGSGSRSVNERERRLQRDGSGSGRGSGSTSASVATARGLEGAAREAVWWRVGECAATERQWERERAVAVADAGSVEKCRRMTSTSWEACCVPIECRRLRKGPRRRV